MTPDSSAPRRRMPLAAKIVIAMFLGAFVGELIGQRAAPLSRVGTVILDLIKGLAGPLLLFGIIDTFLRTQIEGRAIGRMIAIALCNATLAIVIGLTISNVLQPGRSLVVPSAVTDEKPADRFSAMARAVPHGRRIEFLNDLLDTIPTSVVKPFLDNSVLSIVILAVLAGAALRHVKNRGEAAGLTEHHALEAVVATAYRAIETMLSWAVQLVPIAVFAVVARAIGQEGLAPLRGLAVYLGVGILGLGLQVLVVYQLWLVFTGVSLRRFWAGAREVFIYAMGTGSSLASLPVTLRALDRMGVSPRAARLAACVGTNLNNDGILLYEAMAVLFVAQACGIRFTLSEQLLAAASCAVAGIGISGIPEAGLISLLLVLKTVKQIPDAQVATIVPLLLTVDWVLGRCRAMTNVTSDMVVAVLLDRFDGGVALQRRPPEHSDLPPSSDPDGI